MKLDERDWIIIRLMSDTNWKNRNGYTLHRTILYMMERLGTKTVVDAVDTIREEGRIRNEQQSDS